MRSDPGIVMMNTVNASPHQIGAFRRWLLRRAPPGVAILWAVAVLLHYFWEMRQPSVCLFALRAAGEFWMMVALMPAVRFCQSVVRGGAWKPSHRLMAWHVRTGGFGLGFCCWLGGLLDETMRIADASRILSEPTSNGPPRRRSAGRSCCCRAMGRPLGRCLSGGRRGSHRSNGSSLYVG